MYCVPSCEPNYFSHDENYEKGLSWYLKFFETSQEYQHRGEGSNCYSARSLYPNAAKRIFEMNPETRIIFMARHPVQRIISAWIQRRSDVGDAVPPTVDAAIRAMPDEYIGQSRYYYNIEPYLTLFPRNNIFIGFMEDLKENEEKFFGNLCEFLNVELAPVARNHVNPSLGKRIPNTTFTRINSSRLVRSTKRFLPQELKRTIKSKLTTEISYSDIRISPTVLEETVEILRVDARSFLAYSGKPLDYWDFTGRS